MCSRSEYKKTVLIFYELKSDHQMFHFNYIYTMDKNSKTNYIYYTFIYMIHWIRQHTILTTNEINRTNRKTLKQETLSVIVSHSY